MEKGVTKTAYQERTEHVKADEVDNGKVAPTSVLLSRVIIGVWVAQLPWEAGKHDLLPGFPCRTPV